MIDQILVRLFLFATMAWASSAQATSVVVESDSGEAAAADSSILRAYQFVSTIITDQRDRTRCPIKIQFRNLDGQFGHNRLLGFVEPNQEPCNEKILLNSSLRGTVNAQVIFAHELTHLLRQQYNPHEEFWLSEGLAELIEIMYSGIWPISHEQRLCTISQFRLSNLAEDFQTRGPEYLTMSYFFMQYLYNHFGERTFIKKIGESSLSGWSNIETAAGETSQNGTITIPMRFLTRAAIWKHFAIALLAYDTSYLSFGLGTLDYRYTPLSQKPNCLLLDSGLQPQLPWSISYSSRSNHQTSLENTNRLLVTFGTDNRLTNISSTHARSNDNQVEILIRTDR